MFAYTDPVELIRDHGMSLFTGRVRSKGVVAFLEPSEAAVDQFVAANRDVKEILFVANSEGKLSKEQLDFFNVLRSRYAQFGVSVDTTTRERALTREGPELSR